MFENIELDPPKTFSRSTKDKKINRVKENIKENIGKEQNQVPQEIMVPKQIPIII